MNNNELTDMLQVFFESNRNRLEAVRRYRVRFPDREVPDSKMFVRIETNLRNYGSFKKPKKQQRRFAENSELDVLLAVQENSRTSTREIAHNIGVSKTTVHSILKKYKFKPYIARKVHALERNDRGRRIQFCRYFLNALEENPNFYRKIIWSDECTFSNNGIFNRNIHRQWSHDNPRFIIENNFQRRFSVNVWCGILGDQLIGPFFIDGSLNQETYHTLLNENLQNFLDELPLADLNRIFYQQDGAPAHNARVNTDWLNIQFENRWIGTSGPIQWPARSPDLSPLDFWLWAYLQDRVYLTTPENVDILRQRIINTCQQIPAACFLNATRGVIRRCALCIEQDGGHFE